MVLRKVSPFFFNLLKKGRREIIDWFTWWNSDILLCVSPPPPESSLSRRCLKLGFLCLGMHLRHLPYFIPILFFFLWSIPDLWNQRTLPCLNLSPGQGQLECPRFLQKWSTCKYTWFVLAQIGFLCKYFSTCHVSGSILGFGDVTVNKTDRYLTSWNMYLWAGHWQEMNNIILGKYWEENTIGGMVESD